MLANDIARCAGIGNDEDGWRDGCETCQRRTSQGGEYTPHIDPPPIIVFECEFYRGPGDDDVSDS
jgi:hypothetical protein